MLTGTPAEPIDTIPMPCERLSMPGFLDWPVRRGEIAVIHAPSGSGKTTMFEKLIGLRPLGPGTAWIDGIDAAWLDPRQRRHILALAPQDAQLISGTVRENLLLARPDASELALWDALADACLDRVVEALPSKLDTWIGENGERLSGGERRRLVLARVLLTDAAWLLLDEPTAGLDDETARRMMGNIVRRVQERGQGTVIAAHEALVLGTHSPISHDPA